MSKKTMKVKLSCCVNYDFEDPNCLQRNPQGPTKNVEVSSFAEASKVCMKYLKDYELGGGNWSGGQIYQDGKQIAHVSPNGHVWEGKEEDWDIDTVELF